jgi:hypothetical protein
VRDKKFEFIEIKKRELDQKKKEKGKNIVMYTLHTSSL